MISNAGLVQAVSSYQRVVLSDDTQAVVLCNQMTSVTVTLRMSEAQWCIIS